MIVTAPASIFRWPPGGEKARLLGAVLLLLFAAYAAWMIPASLARGWPAGFGDSFALWSFGRFVDEHAAASIYDPAILRATQLALGMDPASFYAYPYPPSFLLVLWPLGWLPGWAMCAALILITLPLYLWATVGRNWRSPAVLFALAAPTTTIGIVCGQSSFLAAALLAGGLRLAAGNPIVGGMLLGLLTYKPQLGLLVPVALVSARLWRTLAAAALTACGLVIVTTLLFGGAIWPAWAAAFLSFSHHVPTAEPPDPPSDADGLRRNRAVGRRAGDGAAGAIRGNSGGRGAGLGALSFGPAATCRRRAAGRFPAGDALRLCL